MAIVIKEIDQVDDDLGIDRRHLSFNLLHGEELKLGQVERLVSDFRAELFRQRLLDV